MVNCIKFIGMEVAKSGPAQELEAEQVMDGDACRWTDKSDSRQGISCPSALLVTILPENFPVFTSDSTFPISFQTKTPAGDLLNLPPGHPRPHNLPDL